MLADRGGAQGSAQVWARLADGTPLVTASKSGEGWLVLFHITANSDWSNLPMSGLFVDMLRRTAEMSNVAGAPDSDAEGGRRFARQRGQRLDSRTAFLTPWRTLDGYGRMGPPPVTANALPAANTRRHPAGPDPSSGILRTARPHAGA